MNHYEQIAKSLEYIAENFREQPTLADISARASMSETHFQRVFTLWAGVSPKKFLQYVTLEHAKHCLENSASVFDASLDSGLSGSSRLHDLFVQVEAMTPGEFKRGGLDLEIHYGFPDTPFGRAVVMVTDRGITSLGFCDPGSETDLLEEFKCKLPKARYVHSRDRVSELANTIFERRIEGVTTKKNPMRLLLAGTDFQLQVWQALLQIPEGSCTSYTEIARFIGREKAQRAIGNAVGANPVALLIPCHRVIRENGMLGGYRWGLARKIGLLGSERLAAG